MTSPRVFPRRDSKNDVTGDWQQTGTNLASDTLLSELAELLSELHQTLQDYAPTWYTQTMDHRIREKLAVAQRLSAGLQDRE